MNELETTRALFGRAPAPEAPAPDVDEPSTGPVIPGQEKAPAYTNRTTTSTFINELFNN